MALCGVGFSGVGNLRWRSELPRIVGPVEEGLALSGAAGEIAPGAIVFDLGDVAAEGEPAFDLAVVIFAAAAAVIAAIPLEPAAGVLVINPAFLLPDVERLGGIDAEEIEGGVMALVAEAGVFEPGGGEFGGAIGHVFSAEDAEFEHFHGGELRAEGEMEIAAGVLGEAVGVAFCMRSWTWIRVGMEGSGGVVGCAF